MHPVRRAADKNLLTVVGFARISLVTKGILANSLFGGEIVGNGTVEAPVIFLSQGTVSAGREVAILDFVEDAFIRCDVTELIFDVAGAEQGASDGRDFISTRP